MESVDSSGVSRITTIISEKSTGVGGVGAARGTSDCDSHMFEWEVVWL